jgi:hypothetical protein
MPGELDDDPDWTEPEAWSHAAEFIVAVHTEMPEELRREAMRGVAAGQNLVDAMVGALPCINTRR